MPFRSATTPGRLRHRLVLETPQETPDGGGGADTAWSAITTLWAEIEPLSATQHVAAGHVETAISHRIRIRYRPDVTGEQRFRLGTRIFAIRAAFDADQGGRFLLCLCEETGP